MPYGDLFCTKEGIRFLLAVGSDHQFLKLCAILGVDTKYVELYSLNRDRVSHHQEVNLMLQLSIELLLYNELEQRFSEANIPYCRINHLGQVFEHPLAARMILSRVESGRTAKSVSTIAFEIV